MRSACACPLHRGVRSCQPPRSGPHPLPIIPKPRNVAAGVLLHQITGMTQVTMAGMHPSLTSTCFLPHHSLQRVQVVLLNRRPPPIHNHSETLFSAKLIVPQRQGRQHSKSDSKLARQEVWRLTPRHNGPLRPDSRLLASCCGNRHCRH